MKDHSKRIIRDAGKRDKSILSRDHCLLLWHWLENKEKGIFLHGPIQVERCPSWELVPGQGAAPLWPPQHVCACGSSSGSQPVCKPLTGSHCQLLVSANGLGILESTSSVSNGAYIKKKKKILLKPSEVNIQDDMY